jgi:hypothetical protein
MIFALELVDSDGFEPPMSETPDLQSGALTALPTVHVDFV